MKKKLWILAAFALAISLTATADQWFNSSGVELGQFTKVKCGTNVSCTQSSGKLTIAASTTSPITLADSETITNASDVISFLFDDAAASVKFVGFEASDSKLTLQADESDDNGDDWELKAAASGNAFTLSNDTSGSQVAKITVATDGSVLFTGTIAGHLQPQVAATATTITAAQCGSTFSNTGAVQMELPEASTVIGCTLTFVTLNASNFDINPDNGDQILVLTNAVGDAIRNATLGNTVILRAVSASQWAQLAAVGTWTDIN